MTTPWKLHYERWKLGCGSGLCRQPGVRVVLGRGKLPADVVFVGEAPGEGENVLGLPFVGPAGKLLDRIVSASCLQAGIAPGSLPRLAFTNLVACIPREEDGSKATEPEDDEVKACSPRLSEFVQIASPRLLVAVGKLAEDWLTPGYKHSVPLPEAVPDIVKIIHPAAILRANVAQQGLMVQRSVIALSGALRELFGKGAERAEG